MPRHVMLRCWQCSDFGAKWNLLGMIVTRISHNTVSAQLCAARSRPAYEFMTIHMWVDNGQVSSQMMYEVVIGKQAHTQGC